MTEYILRFVKRRPRSETRGQKEQGMANQQKQATFAQEARLKGAGRFTTLSSLLALSSAAAASAEYGSRTGPYGMPQAQPAPLRKPEGSARLRPLADLPPVGYLDPLRTVRLRPVQPTEPNTYMHALGDLPPLHAQFDPYAPYMRQQEPWAAVPAPVRMETPYWAYAPISEPTAPYRPEHDIKNEYLAQAPRWAEEAPVQPEAKYPAETETEPAEAFTFPAEEAAVAPEAEYPLEAETEPAEAVTLPVEEAPVEPEAEYLPEAETEPAEAEAFPAEEAPVEQETEYPPETETEPAEAFTFPAEEAPVEPEAEYPLEAETVPVEVETVIPATETPAEPEAESQPEAEPVEKEDLIPAEAVSAATEPDNDYPIWTEPEEAEAPVQTDALGPAEDTAAAEEPESAPAFEAETEEPEQTFILDEILSTAREAPEDEAAHESPAFLSSVKEESFVTDETLSYSGKVPEALPLVAAHDEKATLVSGVARAPHTGSAALEEKDTDEEDEPGAGEARFSISAQDRLPEPVPVSSETQPRHPKKRRRLIKWLFGIALLAAVGVALYQSGLLTRLLPATTPETVTISPLPSITELNLGSANNTPVATTTPVITTELRSVTVEPGVTTAPATLTFTLVTNEATTSIRLMTEDGQMLHTTANSASQDDGLVWQITTELSQPYTGEIHIFLRDQDGVWNVGSIPCTVTVE
jgi:hypothetical protein